MATQTNFDLNKEISAWREELWTTGKFNSDELDELESHLREEADCIAFASLSDEQKFVLAQHKLGSKDTLQKAYENNLLTGFLRVSWLAQSLICFLIFIILSRLAIFILGDLDQAFQMDNLYLEASLYWGLQLLFAATAFMILRKTLRMSKTESRLPRANGIVIVSLLITLAIYLIYTRISAFGFVLNGPVIMYIVPYLIFLGLFITFVVANFRARKKLRLSHH